MDDLLREFLTETGESLDVVDVELVRFEQEPNNAKILDNIFRLVHTIKGTYGFLGLPRLEALAHAAETLMGKFRDGLPVTGQAVTLILTTIDRIKDILGKLEDTESEPEGVDQDLIDELQAMAERGMAAMSASASSPMASASATAPVMEDPAISAPAEALAAVASAVSVAEGALVPQVLERALRPGEVSLDELERAFRETAIEAPSVVPPQAPVQAPPQSTAAAKPAAAKPVEGKPMEAKSAESKSAGTKSEAGKTKPAAKKTAVEVEMLEGDKIANQSIRVNVDTLEHLMTMVSELVLTRNQLLEISRRQDDSAYKVPLQRLSHVTAELQEGVMKTRMQPIGSAWQKLPRIVRDVAAELGKQIDLVM